MKLTKALEDYLEEVHVLILAGRRARVRDVASQLHVKMPSVVKAVAELKRMNLVSQEPYGDIELTPAGREVAGQVLGRHKILRVFLQKLGVSDDVADRDACTMEHILSAETMDRITEFLGEDAATVQTSTTEKERKAAVPPRRKAAKK